MLLKVIQFSIIYLVVSLFLINEVAGKAYTRDDIQTHESDYQLKEIPKPLEDGTTLEIKGYPVLSGEKFEIDFMDVMDKSNGNIGFHMKYEFYDIKIENRRLVFNSRENGKWSNEEIYKYPDVTSFPKLIRITVRTDHFQIDVNDDTYTFKYRMPIERIKFFGYGGYFKFESVIWK